MDKQRLNKEIVLLRGAVKKSKLCIISKTVKNLRLLEKCKSKDEKVKDKKKRRAERLLNELKILKKLKEDDVTKFSLRNENFSKYNQSTCDMHEHIMAKVSQHKLLQTQINILKLKFVNSEIDLQTLLDDLGNRKNRKNSRTENQISSRRRYDRGDQIQENLKPERKKLEQEDSEIESNENSSESDHTSESDNELMVTPVQEMKETESAVKKKSRHKPEEAVDQEEHEVKLEKDSLKKQKTQPEQRSKVKISSKSNKPELKKQESSESEEEPELVPIAEPEVEKVYDPFFINKKVCVPILKMVENDSSVVESVKTVDLDVGLHCDETSSLRTKPEKRKFETKMSAEKKVLHPSWEAAKKKQAAILPFQGKKILFDE